METMVVGFSPQEVNLSYNVGQRKVPHFQRGQSFQFLQILAPHKYVLSDNEKDNLRVMSLDYNPANKFDTYCWNNDFLWYFGHAVHIKSLLVQWKAYNDEEKNNYVHNTIMCMCYNRLNTNYVDRQLESQRGHKDHKQWILDTQVKDEEVNDEDNDEGNDGDNDDAMGGTKKRKVGN